MGSSELLASSPRKSASTAMEAEVVYLARMRGHLSTQSSKVSTDFASEEEEVVEALETVDEDEGEAEAEAVVEEEELLSPYVIPSSICSWTFDPLFNSGSKNLGLEVVGEGAGPAARAIRSGSSITAAAFFAAPAPEVDVEVEVETSLLAGDKASSSADDLASATSLRERG